jgi:predicted DNA binding CopG/RHH family protein
MRKTKKIKLDAEEQAILESVENGEWKSVKNLAKDMVAAKETAGRFLRKDKRINIRMSGIDLERLKRMAAYEGLPYQTYIASVLHKYASGHSCINFN